MVVEVVAAEVVMEEVMVDIMDLEVMVSFVLFLHCWESNRASHDGQAIYH
jgi:hypothetical protein